MKQKEEIQQSTTLSKSASALDIKMDNANDYLRSRGKTLINVEQVEPKIQHHRIDGSDQIIENTNKLKDNENQIKTSTLDDSINREEIKGKDNIKLVDLDISFNIPKFKFICNGTLCNEDQAKMIADLNLKKAKRKHIIMELLETEKSYVNRMKECLDTFYIPLKKYMKEEDLKIAFNCLPNIYKINVKLIQELNERKNNTSDLGVMKVADILNSFFTLNEVEQYYGEYIITGDSAVTYPFEIHGEEIKTLLSKWVDECKIPSNYLIEPVQRFPRYILLLESLIKATPTFTNEYIELQKVNEHIKEITKRIDEKKNNYISHQKQNYYKSYLPHPINFGTFIYEGSYY
ncbi:Rho/RAC guanine nucleotide exchange factor, putative, partial [Entamoeba dispar SAW760]